MRPRPPLPASGGWAVSEHDLGEAAPWAATLIVGRETGESKV
jgi:hypothetical protein